MRVDQPLLLYSPQQSTSLHCAIPIRPGPSGAFGTGPGMDGHESADNSAIVNVWVEIKEMKSLSTISMCLCPVHFLDQNETLAIIYISLESARAWLSLIG